MWPLSNARDTLVLTIMEVENRVRPSILSPGVSSIAVSCRALRNAFGEGREPLRSNGTASDEVVLLKMAGCALFGA